MSTKGGKNSGEVWLSSNWTKSRVQECLDNGQRDEILRFLKERHAERFFCPISMLRHSPGNYKGFGFAIMALSSLLIETIECYRQGLPTSADSDLKDLLVGCQISLSLRNHLPKELPGSKQIFIDFFGRPEHKKFFPGVDGELFYTKIRCGLLHQAQTKGQWRIIRSGKSWDPASLTINRDEFSARLEECFEGLLDELKSTNIAQGSWPNVCRKVRWLTETS